MQITFTSLPKQQPQLNLLYPHEFISSGHLQQRRSSVTSDWGALKIDELWFEGACLISSDFKIHNRCSMKVECNNFCWIMNFVLNGEISIQSNDAPTRFNLEKGNYHTFYCSALDIDMMVYEPTKVFTICLTRRFISKLVGTDLLPQDFEGDGKEALTLVTTDEYRDNRFNVLIREIMEASQPDYIQRIFLEAKILELLSLQLERLENKQLAPINFSKEDVSRLEEAKTLVEQNLQTPCSLIELARKTGLNDFKLKKGFKTLFGHTVFGYLFELRMDTAYRLLKDGKSVGEVSEMVGYKNPHHFTSAFKKKYSMLPSQIGKILAFIVGGFIQFT